jgi:hypothetical protein
MLKGIAAALLLAVPRPADDVTPDQWLKAQPRPRFREGHTLPPLTRFGWTLPFETRVELTENWGFALEFGGYRGGKAGLKLIEE